MSVLADGQTARVEARDSSVRKKSFWTSWLLSYELYLILIIASFLRLYGIQTTEFDADQADIFHMAHNAVIHGHLVATSNVASIGVYNPPGIIYALMIPATFSANPIGGAIETALLAIFGIFLTYWFTRRYYGRVAAAIASSLFAVTSVSLFYSRFMWNQNLLLFFVPLFMIVLFRGVVERKPGWLFPAIFLYGLLFQWHGSSLLLAAPLVAAWLLAPKTVRWRDVVLGLLSLIILYSPYIVWQVATNFATLSRLFQSGPLPPTIDDQAWLFYLHFLNPYDKPFANSLALLYRWQRYFNWLHPVMKCLIIVAILCVLLLALFLHKKKTGSRASHTNLHSMEDLSTSERRAACPCPVEAVIGYQGRDKPLPLRVPSLFADSYHVMVSWWQKLWNWVYDLRESPYRGGLLVLLVWQIFPLLYLSRHTLILFPHYFIILMPGPFILIGILLARSADWFRARGQWYRFVSVGIYVFSCLLLLFQAIAGTASVLDSVQGHYVDKNFSSPYYNDLNSLQQALAKADQIAQQGHLSRVVVVADQATKSAFHYLSGQLHTPATVVDASCLLLPSPLSPHSITIQHPCLTVDNSCLILPSPSAGPSVVLVPPYETTLDAFFSSRNIHVDRSYTSARLGGDPFHLYVVDPLPQASTQGTLSSDIQFDSAKTQILQKKSWVVTHWNLLRSAPASDFTTYSYGFINMDTVKGSTQTQQVCTSTRVQAGDQLIAFLPQTNSQTSLRVQVERSSTTPHTITTKLFGALPLAFDTFQEDSSPWRLLKTDAGASTITAPITLSS